MMQMWKHDYRDIVAGGFFVLCGLSAAIYAALHYKLGDFSAMGPGMFPTLAGIMVALFGFGILVPAVFTVGEKPHVDLRSAAAVLAGVAAFAAAAAPFGLVPATFLLTGISMLADDRASLRAVLVLAAILSALAFTIFSWGLGVQLVAWRWPL